MDLLEVLKFKALPFPKVPTQEFAKLMADRQKIKEITDKIVHVFKLTLYSSIHPVWGWFGSGKTHTLYYLKNLLSDEEDFLVVYTEFPTTARGFKDLYISFINSFLYSQEFQKFLKISQELYNDLSEREKILRELQKFNKDFPLFFKFMVFDENLDFVTRWLICERISITDSREIGLNKKIDYISNDNKALGILSGLVYLLKKHSTTSRLIWMIDEFQRIITTKRNVQNSIWNGLTSLFNSNPTNLSIFLSYSGRQEQKIKQLLPDALISRIDASFKLSIPPLEKTEVKQFVLDLFSFYRTTTVDNPYFPFTEDAIDTLAEWIDKEKWFLKPRNILEILKKIILSYESELIRGAVVDTEKLINELNNIKKDSQFIDILKRVD